MVNLGSIVFSIILAFGLSLLLLARSFYLWYEKEAPAWWDLLLPGSLFLIAGYFLFIL